MSIAINPGTAFDIETYDGLLAYVTEHLELDADTVTQLPSMLRLAEYRLDRLLTIAQRESFTNLLAVAGSSTVSLPNDLRSVEAVEGLKQIPLTQLLERYADKSGDPLYFAIGNQELVLGPVPAQDTTLKLTYLTRLEPLTEQNQTNWLLSENADVYKYALLFQVSTWLEDLAAAESYRAEMFAIIDEVNLQASEFRNGAPMVPHYGFVV